jgi:hypothetical protein
MKYKARITKQIARWQNVIIPLIYGGIKRLKIAALTTWTNSKVQIVHIGIPYPKSSSGYGVNSFYSSL